MAIQHLYRRHVTVVVSLFVLISLCTGISASMVDSSALAQGLQANPTATPTPRVTEESEPLNVFQVEPTEAVIDDVIANPTERPPEQPADDLQANPTEVPRQEPIDDEAIAPTDTPDIGEPPLVQGTVRVVKRDCPVGIAPDALLVEYLQLCPHPLDDVEFVLNDSNGAQAGVTASGVVEWIDVDPGVFNITETVPAGFGDPIVFCGYTESLGGGVQHPSRQESTGGIVAGTFPYDANFEYVCYWMNVKSGGVPGIPPVYADPHGGDGTGEFQAIKYQCPTGTPRDEQPAQYLDTCTEALDGVPFTVTDDSGASTKTTSNGKATWSGIPLGPFMVDEDLPAQFGDPVVFCGWTAIHEGVVYDAFDRFDAPGGVVELEVMIPGAFHFCYFFNISTGPGGFADAGQFANTLVTRKWMCPDGTLSNQPEREYYFQRCELMLESVDFTLATAAGDEPQATSGGFAEWSGLPVGPYTLREAIPAGYGAPVFFCGWYAEYGGYHYDAFPQLVILAATGVFDGEIHYPNTDAFCDVFNIVGGIDDIQANPTQPPAIDDFQTNATAGIVWVEKRDCPLGVPTDATLSDYLTICTQLHDGVEFSLETAGGAVSDTTAMGRVDWTGVPGGAFSILEMTPAGYVDPIVFCGYTESPGGGVQHPSLQPSDGGVVSGTLPTNSNFEYACYWMNIPDTGQVGFPGADDVANPQGGSNVFTLDKLVCPADVARDELLSYYFDECSEAVGGFTFTLTNEDGSLTKPTTGGEAVWPGVPAGIWTLEETPSVMFGEPIVFCGWTATNDGIIVDTFAQLATVTDGAVSGEISLPNTWTFCFWMNVQSTPDSFAQPQDTTNSLTVRKWICPGGTESIADQAYLEVACDLSNVSVEMTLTNADGSSAQATSPGWTTWDDVPLGPFTLEETVPAGFSDPIVFCGSTALFEGNVYDDLPHLVAAAGGVVEGIISIPNSDYECDFYNITSYHSIQVISVVCPNGANPVGGHWDGCEEFVPGIDYDLTTDGGTTSGTTDAMGRITWSYIDLGVGGEIQLQEQTPAGLGDPTAWCVSFPVIAGDAQDFEFFEATVTNGTITAQPEQHFPYRFSCTFFHFPGGVAFDTPGGYANPTDESNTLVARTWLCPDGTPADAHLLNFFNTCDPAIDPVEFALDNADGASSQATVDGVTQWDDVPLGPFTLEEQLPAGFAVLSVWCGFTAFYNGAVYDGFHQSVPFQNGMVEREISVPNSHYVCHFMNVPVSIDDLQANPTEVPAIDDFQQNPGGTGTLIVNLWGCPAGYDSLAGDALADCTEPLDGVIFGLFNHFVGMDYWAMTGAETSGTAVFEPNVGTYSLIESLPAGYEQPFLWNCSGLGIEGLAPPISTINFFRIVIDAGQTIECDWMNVPSAVVFETPDSLQANPTG